ncbi:TPA: hypothetical protein QDA90_003489 [Burkholderia vietnamiensis]|uniref:hypothetical protein n=1 Tax=Burkholderia vietnamiensis TaxID=60552 RepID=UPI00298A1490|nr:hypothetical protein [Burkholderia vietnamiensis]
MKPLSVPAGESKGKEVKRDSAITIAVALLISTSAIIRLLGLDALLSFGFALALVAIGLLISEPIANRIREKKCRHDWQPHVRHRSHDVGHMADKCSRCGTVKHYIG